MFILVDELCHIPVLGVNLELAMSEGEVKRFGEKLRTLRTRKGLSVRALAMALGISSGAISEVENSTRQPRIDFAHKVSRYFDVSTDDLLYDEREV